MTLDRIGKNARANRHNPTEPEARLWRHLSASRLGGLKFRRQHPVESWIVDFFYASVIMVVKARDHHQWIACDCLGEGTDPPLLSPAYLSEAETYYLRRLTSIRQRRPEHDVDCPFFREQAPPRIREKATATPRTINEPDGLFSAHRLAPEKLAPLPHDCEPRLNGLR